MIAKQLLDNHLMTAWQPPGDCLTTRWPDEHVDSCRTNNWPPELAQRWPRCWPIIFFTHTLILLQLMGNNKTTRRNPQDFKAAVVAYARPKNFKWNFRKILNLKCGTRAAAQFAIPFSCMCDMHTINLVVWTDLIPWENGEIFTRV